MADVSDPSSYQYLQCNHCGFLRHRREVVTHRPQGRNDYHITYLLDGELEVMYNKEKYILHKGDFVYYPPHTEQWYRDIVGVHRVWVHFTGFVVPQILDESRLTPGVHRAALSPYVMELFERLVNENRAGHTVSSENGLLLEVLLELGKLVGTPQAASRLGDCVEYLNRHYQESLSVDELARMSHLSVSRFMNVFKVEQGVTPVQYLRRLRIEQACALLGATDLPIGEIAYACGYDDPLYFCRVFRRHKGQSPTQYRQSIK